MDRCLALDILPVEKTTLLRARALSGSDFEDNVGMACAEAAHLEAIVTRNPDDFRQSPVAVLAPLALVVQLDVKGQL